MFRIDNPTAVTVLPTVPSVGIPGYFTKGNPATAVDATIVDDWWLNTVQEEIIAVIVNAGLTLDKNDRTQLYQAILDIAGGFQSSIPPLNFLPLTGGQLHQAGTSDLLTLYVDSGQYNRIGYTTGIAHHWAVGLDLNGNFAWTDSTDNTTWMSITVPDGTLHVTGPIMANGATFAGTVTVGSVVASGTVRASGNIYANDLYLTDRYILFDGNTNPNGGPLIYADISAMNFECGTGNGGFSFVNSGGTIIMNLAALSGNCSIYGGLTCSADVHANNGVFAGALNVGLAAGFANDLTVAGNLGCNNLTVNGNIGDGGTIGIAGNMTVSGNIGANNGTFGGNVAVGLVLSVSGNANIAGTVTCNNLVQTSDDRVKGDIEQLDIDVMLDGVKALRPVSYLLRDSEERSFGVRASDLAGTPLAGAVYHNEADGLDYVSYSHLLAAALGAIQRLDARLDALGG